MKDKVTKWRPSNGSLTAALKPCVSVCKLTSITSSTVITYPAASHDLQCLHGVVCSSLSCITAVSTSLYLLSPAAMFSSSVSTQHSANPNNLNGLSWLPTCWFGIVECSSISTAWSWMVGHVLNSDSWWKLMVYIWHQCGSALSWWFLSRVGTDPPSTDSQPHPVQSRSTQCRSIFSTRCSIYISRLCYDVSVCLSVCDGSALAHYS